ncbi:hypothetical protein [Streptomyces sp. NPDC002078]
MRRRLLGFVAAAIAAMLAILPAAMPAQADTLPDPWTQIVNGHLPIASRGQSTYFPGGRYYTGPNGLEIRFTSDGTGYAVAIQLGIATQGSSAIIQGTADGASSLIMAAIKGSQLAGLVSAETRINDFTGGALNDAIKKLALGSRCLGVTVPSSAISGVINRATQITQVASGNPLSVLKNILTFNYPADSDIQEWFEDCNTPTAGSGDIVVPARFPGIQDAVAAQPIDTSGGHNPIGFLDEAGLSADRTRITVRGWAIDPDTTSPIIVHTYIDGALAGATTANTSRPDVGAAHPGFGDNHGYYAEYPAGVGRHIVCTYAINTGTGDGNPELSDCRTVEIFKPSSSVTEHAGSLYAFAKGVDNEIYRNTWNGSSWSGFQRLDPGSVFEGNPTAVEFNSELKVFARGINHEIYCDTLTSSGWTGFQRLAPGAVFASDPVAAQFGGSLGVFARGTDNEIYDNSLGNGTWSGFVRLQAGAVFQGNPAVVGFNGGLHVFGRGTDNQLYKNTWNGTSWSGFSNLQAGAVFEGDPAVAQYGNSLGVFARGVNHEIYDDSWDGTNWSGFVRLNPGAVFEGDPAVATFNSGLHVFARGTDHQIYKDTWNGTSWGGFSSLQTSATFAGGPVATQFGGALGVFGRGVDNEMYDNSWDGTTWSSFIRLQAGAVFTGP